MDTTPQHGTRLVGSWLERQLICVALEQDAVRIANEIDAALAEAEQRGREQERATYRCETCGSTGQRMNADSGGE